MRSFKSSCFETPGELKSMGNQFIVSVLGYKGGLELKVKEGGEKRKR